MAMIFNPEVVTSIAIEEVKDNLLNAQTKTGGAITIGESIHKGDFLETTLFDTLGEAVRRDPNVDTDDTATRLSSLANTDVKLYFKKLVFATYTELARYGTSVEEMNASLGIEIGKGVSRYILSKALIAAAAAIQSEADSIYTSAAAVPSLLDINQGIFKFGDMSEDIITLVMPSVVMGGLVGAGISSSADKISYGAVYGGQAGTLNRAAWVVDSAALTTGKNKILGLTRGAIMVDESEMVRFLTDTEVKTENAGMYLRSEGAYTVKVKGFSYDQAAGANPGDAVLGASANWNLIGDRKGSAGIIVVGA